MHRLVNADCNRPTKIGARPPQALASGGFEPGLDNGRERITQKAHPVLLVVKVYISNADDGVCVQCRRSGEGSDESVSGWC